MPQAPPEPSPRPDRRIITVARFGIAAMAVAFVLLLGRVAHLQVKPPPLVEQRLGERASQRTIPARRGALLDTRGRPLAVSRLGYRLYVDPQLIEDPLSFSAHLAHVLGDDPARIDRVIDERADRRYAVVESLLNDAQLEAARALNLRAVGIEPRPVRHYPHRSLAGQVLGFVGTEHIGLDGVEFALDPVLGGRTGRVSALRDVRRRPLWVERSAFAPPRDGFDVRLSIDAVVQKIAEAELAATCEEYRADRGELVVMDARSGQLLALANWPPFNPLAPGTEPDVRRNRCVTDPYEPGSVFKPFLHAHATAAGLAHPKQKIDCTDVGVWYTSAGRRLRDTQPHGTITWEEVLLVSSNIGMGRVASQLGTQRMYDAVKAFGFGRSTGTALPGESRGIVNPVGSWTHYSLTSIPMGQEIAVTPVQMVQAFSVFANNGLMVAPSILASEARAPVYERVLEPENADAMRRLLRRVVTEGTGRRAQSALYQIWGKTGTAQVPDRERGGYKPRTYSASFVGGAPLRDPRIIVHVAVHEPDPSIAYYGGVISAPAARRVVERVLPYLGVAPDVEDPTGEAPATSLVQAD